MRLSPDTEDVCGLVGMEPHKIAASAPEIALVAEQIVHLVSLVLDPAELIDRHIDERILKMEWIERDDDQDDVVPRRGHLRVVEDEVVFRALELQVAQLLQGAVFAAAAVEPRDDGGDVAGRIAVP